MPTPNPNSVKFSVNRDLIERGSLDFPDKDSATTSPLAASLFEIDGIIGVMVGTKFVSIVKEQDAGWENVLEPATDKIKTMIENGDKLVDETLIEAIPTGEEDSDVVKKIKSILDEEIRPAIAMDGGDCVFHSFEEGVLTLKLQGACSTCPASVMTLKMGIENRLKEDIPELEEVIQLS